METMTHLIDKDALIAEIEKKIKRYRKYYGTLSNAESRTFLDGRVLSFRNVLDLINYLDDKEVDFELITHWFDHIAQIADDRKTANGTVMEDWAALDEIKCLAKNSSEFMKMHYKAQKGE